MDTLLFVVVIIGAICGLMKDSGGKKKNKKKKNMSTKSTGGGSILQPECKKAQNSVPQPERKKTQNSVPQQGQGTYGNTALPQSRKTAAVRSEDRKQAVGVKVQADAPLNTADVLRESMEKKEAVDLMDQVQDLIIMGYQAKLTFARDFVGEGQEMLGQWEY